MTKSRSGQRTGVGGVIGGGVQGVRKGIAEAVVLAVPELAAVGDYDRADRRVARRRLRVLHTPHDAHPFEHLRQAWSGDGG